jgi:23S rRNA (adenine2503-C2)-methyltransferase
MGHVPQSELLGQPIQQLTEICTRLGQPAYRARQLYDALYHQRLASVELITTLPVALRQQLSAEGYQVGMPEVEQRFVSTDGTVRYLLRFADGQSVETVWMPEGDGAEDGDEVVSADASTQTNASPAAASAPVPISRRATICLSSQAGCAVNCRFCMTALLGLQRNLSAGEIVGQVLVVLNDHHVEIGRDRVNLVFMGQGEPFLNYENFIAAVRLLVEAVGLSEQRMTVSTSGIVPRIADFGREAIRPNLAISLNASNDAVREQVMPINRKWPLAEIIKAARSFPLRQRERLTFEYVLLDGVNDSVENAREVTALLRGLRAKVNLIALNPGPEIAYRTPSPERVAAFQQTLMRAGIPAFLRRPRGLDIYAACGQLKRTRQLTQLG